MLRVMEMATDRSRTTGEAALSFPVAFRIALCEAAGVEANPLEIDGIASPSLPLRPAWSEWQQALRGQLGVHGVVTRDLNASLAQVLGALQPGAPIVTWTPGGGWIAFLERKGGRVRIAGPETPSHWVPVDAVADAIDPVLTNGYSSWIAIEARFLSDASRRTADGRPGPFGTLLAIVRPERSDVIAIVIYSAFSGLMSLAIPVAVQQLVNTVAFGGLVQPVVVLASMLFMGLAIAAFLYGSQAVLAELLQQRLFVRACLDLAHRLPRLSDKAFESRPMVAYVNRFFDLVTVQKTGARLLLEASGVTLQAAAGLFVLSLYHPLMLATSIFLLATMAFVTFSFGRRAPASAVRESTTKYEIAAWMEELVRHPTLFRSSAGRARAESRADLLVASWVNARKSHYRIVFRQYCAALVIHVIVNAGLLALGGYLVVAGELTLGQLVASEIVVASVVASFVRLAKHYETFYDLLAACEKVGDLFELPLERASHGDDAMGDAAAPRLSGSGLSLAGQGGSALPAWSIDVGIGERIALAGGSSSDQSSCIDVLAGLRAPAKGFVTLRGRALRDWSPQAIRDRVMVLRMPQIVPGSILENLGLSTQEMDLDHVQAALAAVGLLEEIRRLPEGLETRLNERGAPLDADQLQRLEIARVLLAKPDVVLLDLPRADLGDKAWCTALDALFDADAPWALVTTSEIDGIAERCDRSVRVDVSAHGSETASEADAHYGGPR